MVVGAAGGATVDVLGVGRTEAGATAVVEAGCAFDAGASAPALGCAHETPPAAVVAKATAEAIANRGKLRLMLTLIRDCLTP